MSQRSSAHFRSKCLVRKHQERLPVLPALSICKPLLEAQPGASLLDTLTTWVCGGLSSSGWLQRRVWSWPALWMVKRCSNPAAVPCGGLFDLYMVLTKITPLKLWVPFNLRPLRRWNSLWTFQLLLGAGDTRVSKSNVALGDFPWLQVQPLCPTFLGTLSRKHF